MTDTFVVDCPNCKVKVAAEETGRANQTGFNEHACEPYGSCLYVGECPRCGTILAAKSEQIRFKGWEGEDQDVWTDPVRVYPNPLKTLSSFRIPNHVTISLSEADSSLQANAPYAACVMFGRALEAVCCGVLYTVEEKKAIRAGTSKKILTLFAGIKQLRDKNVIDDRLFNWSKQLHAFRNLAAHPDGDGGSIVRQDAEDLKIFVYAIIEYIYDLTDRYEEFKERQQRRLKAKPKASDSNWSDDT